MVALGAGMGAQAAPLDLPAPYIRQAEVSDPAASLAIATGPFANGAVPLVIAEGALQISAWKIPEPGANALRLIAPLRQRLLVAGYQIVFECADRACGGFDFRFEIETLPEPEMHVDLGDFHYLAARRGGAGPDDHIAIVTSSGPGAGYVQIAQIGGPVAPLPETVAQADTQADAPATDIALALERSGRAPLDDLEFDTGSAALGARDFASLADLAEYLRLHPHDHVVLVGHTDAEGSLAANVALSRRRAEAVRARLISAHGAAAHQISAEGIGYLAPRAHNQSPDTRAQNRRVEAVLITIR